MHELNTKNMAVRQKCLAAFLYVRGQIVPAMFIYKNAYITQIFIDSHTNTKRNFQKTGTIRTRSEHARIYAILDVHARCHGCISSSKIRCLRVKPGTIRPFFSGKSYDTI